MSTHATVLSIRNDVAEKHTKFKQRDKDLWEYEAYPQMWEDATENKPHDRPVWELLADKNVTQEQKKKIRLVTGWLGIPCTRSATSNQRVHGLDPQWAQ
jgi:hypothetical protein